MLIDRGGSAKPHKYEYGLLPGQLIDALCLRLWATIAATKSIDPQARTVARDLARERLEVALELLNEQGGIPAALRLIHIARELAGPAILDAPLLLEAIRRLSQTKFRNLSDESDQAWLVHEATRSALQSLRIKAADGAAISILAEAAWLAPTDADPRISASRVFCGVLAVGDRMNEAIQGNHWCIAAASVFANDVRVALAAAKIRALFYDDIADGAIERLRVGFSPSVKGILQRALSQRTEQGIRPSHIQRNCPRAIHLYRRSAPPPPARVGGRRRCDMASSASSRGRQILIAKTTSVLGETAHHLAQWGMRRRTPR